jgi:hypothetical protein
LIYESTQHFIWQESNEKYWIYRPHQAAPNATPQH